MEAITPDEAGRASPVEQGLSGPCEQEQVGCCGGEAGDELEGSRQHHRCLPSAGCTTCPSHLSILRVRGGQRKRSVRPPHRHYKRARHPRGVKKPWKVKSVPEGDVVVQVTMSPPFGMPGLLKTILPDCVS